MSQQYDESLLSDGDILDIVLDAELQMTEALEDTLSGVINPLIIKGPPGTGKSETIRLVTEQQGIVSTDLLSSSWEKDPAKEKNESEYPYLCTKLVQVNGALMRGADYSKWALAADLYANRDNGIVCIDDNDTILKDKDAVAMIMAATEQRETRTISYVKANSTHELQMYGVEPTFEIQTPIIILTNLDMQGMVKYAEMQSEKTKKPVDATIKRWAAMMSRGTYIDLQMNTPRSIRVFCEHKIKATDMLTNSGYLKKNFGRSLNKKESAEVLKWVRFNQGKLAVPLDLRTYIKVAGIMIGRAATWEQSAKVRFLHKV